ncbi:MAG: immunoglobulin domain-containing protein, partial [Verrucomicrobiota bacterium]
MNIILVSLISLGVSASFCTLQAATVTRDALGRISGFQNANGDKLEWKFDSNGNQTNRLAYGSPELTVKVDPPNGGSATGGGRAPRNTQLPLTATPAGGFSFVGWLLPDGSVFSTSSSISYTLTKTETLTAKFTRVEGPAIVEHPEAGQFVPGSTVTLSVSATGKDPLSYSWTHNGQPVSGASSQTYSFPNATFLDAGTYTAEVSDSGGTTRSRDALITIPLPSY